MNTVFDRSADWYSHYYLNRDSGKSARKIIRLLDPSGSNEIIDLGCGTGEITNALSDLGFQLKGIDPSARMIEVARKNFGNSRISWEVGDLSTIPDDSILYGYAYFHVANYILAEMNLFDFLSALKSKIKVGGKFVFDFWKGESISSGGLESRIVTFDIDGIAHTRSVVPILNGSGNVTIDIRVSPVVPNSSSVLTHEKHKLGTFLLDELMKSCELLNLRYSIQNWEPNGLSLDAWDAVCIIERNS